MDTRESIGAKKVDINKILLAGLVGGFCMMIAELAMQGIITSVSQVYGSAVREANPWLPIHILITVLSGIPLAIVYAAAENYFGSGLKTALMIGVLVGSVNLGQVSLTPLEPGGYSIIGFNMSFIKCIIGVLVSGWIYSGNYAALIKKGTIRPHPVTIDTHILPENERKPSI